MDANSIWSLVESGGVVGVLIVVVVYLAHDNKLKSKRINDLVDLHISNAEKFGTLTATVNGTLERLLERIKGA